MRLLRVPLLLLSIAACAFCDTDIKWVNSNGTIWDRYYTSPYYATSSDPALTLTLFCLDYNDEIAPPFEWHANVYALNESNVDNHAQFGGSYPGITGAPDAYVRYLEAAWLFTNIQSAQITHDTNTMIVSQVAAWELFVNAANQAGLTSKINATGGTPAFGNAVAKALVDAHTAVVDNNWGAANAGKWSLVTGDPAWVRDSHGNIPVQEFLTPIHTPEPSALILLATMVGILGTAIRRRIGTR